MIKPTDSMTKTKGGNPIRYSEGVTVNDAIWIATALMAYEVIQDNADADLNDLYFKQSDIVKRANGIASGEVRSARPSKYCCADHPDHNNCYLRGDSGLDAKLRRLTVPGEVPGITYPISVDPDEVFTTRDGKTISFNKLLHFAKTRYANIAGITAGFPELLIDYDRLNKAMKWFCGFVIANQVDNRVSFDTGCIEEREGYKKEIAKNAHNALHLDEWSDTDIGSGKILGYTIDAFNAKTDSGFNNIVQFQNVTKFKASGLADLKTAEDILYGLIKAEDKEKPFNDACRFFGYRFPELSYLMFALDSSMYVPVKTENHRKRFEKLGLNTQIFAKCSWENYCSYLRVNKVIRQRLEEYLGIPITLLDAHSFIWTLGEAPDDFELTDASLIDLTESEDPLESVVITSGKEGKTVLRYVTKYERRPQNRAAAIKIHGCRCMACGFDFEKAYGNLGRGFIEVHHVVPLHSVKEEVVINPETDLVCLCANCHRMIHRKRGSIMTVDELKECLHH